MAKNRDTKYVVGTFWLGVVMLVVAIVTIIVTIIIGRYQVNQAQEIALRSGQFKNADLLLGLGSFTVRPNQEYNIIVGASYNSNTLTFVDLPWTILNRGERNADSICLLFQYFNSHHLVIDSMMVKFNKKGPLGRGQRSMYDIPPFTIAKWDFGSFNPGFEMNFREPYVSYESNVTDTLELKSKDSLDVIMPFSLSYGFNVKVQITARDLPLQLYECNYQGYIAKNVSELENHLLPILQDQYKQSKNKISWLAYLFGRRAIIKKYYFLICSDETLSSKAEDLKIYNISAKREDIRLMIFYPENGNIEIYNSNALLGKVGSVAKEEPFLLPISE